MGHGHEQRMSTCCCRRSSSCWPSRDSSSSTGRASRQPPFGIVRPESATVRSDLCNTDVSDEPTCRCPSSVVAGCDIRPVGRHSADEVPPECQDNLGGDDRAGPPVGHHAYRNGPRLWLFRTATGAVLPQARPRPTDRADQDRARRRSGPIRRANSANRSNDCSSTTSTCWGFMASMTTSACGGACVPNGCLAAARRLQAEGLARHIGFSTHGTTEVILDAINHEAMAGSITSTCIGTTSTRLTSRHSRRPRIAIWVSSLSAPPTREGCSTSLPRNWSSSVGPCIRSSSTPSSVWHVPRSTR